MTVEQFFKELSRTKGWMLDFTGAIRGGGKRSICPVVAVAERRKVAASFVSPVASGKALGLSERTAEAIVSAADNWTPRSRYRSRLLKACGLA